MKVGSITAAIPAYNSERYLGVAIESVLAQTLPCDECLVVDDGSTDGTAEVARSFTGVRYVRKENGGDASARNRAIAEASGEYIAFLDADDVWMPTKIEEQAEVFATRPSMGLVYTGIAVVDKELRPLEELKAAPGHSALRNTLIVEKPYMTGVGSSGMLPTRIAKEVGFDERLRASADWAFGISVALRYPVDRVDRALALYRQHASSQVHRNLPAVEQDMHLVWSELFSDEALPLELRRYRRRATANLDLSLAYAYYRKDDKKRSYGYLGRALARRPDRVAAAFWRRYFG